MWPEPGLLPAGRSIALRPDRTVGPDVNLMHLPDESVLDGLDRAAQAICGAALVAHLRDELSIFGHLTQIARLINRLRQRFLAIHGLVPLHRRRRHNRVHVIRRRNRHRINLTSHLVEHLAEIFVNLRARIFFGLCRVSLCTGIHIAQRDNVLPGTRSVSLWPLPPIPMQAMFNLLFKFWPRSSVGTPNASAPAAKEVVSMKARRLIWEDETDLGDSERTEFSGLLDMRNSINCRGPS